MAAPKTWTVGEIVTASMGNTEWRDQLNALRLPPVGVFRRTTNQSINDTAFTAISWDAEDKDSHNGHDGATNPSRYTVQEAGWYECFATMQWAGNATGVRDLTFRKNGVATNYFLNHLGNVPAANHGMAVGGVIGTSFAVNDYIEVFVQQTSGAALNVVANTAWWSVKLASY